MRPLPKKTFKIPYHAKTTTNHACKDTKRDKLALFAQFCYIDGGRNGRDHPDIEILIHSSSSQQAGENRLNQVFSGVRGQIRSFAGATLIGSTLALGGVVANADETPNQQMTATPVASRTIDATPAIVNPSHAEFKMFKGGGTFRKEVVRTKTARASDNRLAVVVYGVNPTDPKANRFAKMIARAISEAQKDGTEVVLVIGTSDPALFDVGEYKSMTNPMHVEIYENGDLVNGDGGHVLPYLETENGLIENTDFEKDMGMVFSVAKVRFHDSMEIERQYRKKQASLSSPTTEIFPN